MLNSVKSPILEITFSIVYREHCHPADQASMIQDKGQFHEEIFILRFFQPQLFFLFSPVPALIPLFEIGFGLREWLLERLPEMSTANASFTQGSLSFLSTRENHW